MLSVVLTYFVGPSQLPSGVRSASSWPPCPLPSLEKKQAPPARVQGAYALVVRNAPPRPGGLVTLAAVIGEKRAPQARVLRVIRSNGGYSAPGSNVWVLATTAALCVVCNSKRLEMRLDSIGRR